MTGRRALTGCGRWLSGVGPALRPGRPGRGAAQRAAVSEQPPPARAPTALAQPRGPGRRPGPGRARQDGRRTLHGGRPNANVCMSAAPKTSCLPAARLRRTDHAHHSSEPHRPRGRVTDPAHTGSEHPARRRVKANQPRRAQDHNSGNLAPAQGASGKRHEVTPCAGARTRVKNNHAPGTGKGRKSRRARRTKPPGGPASGGTGCRPPLPVGAPGHVGKSPAVATIHDAVTD